MAVMEEAVAEPETVEVIAEAEPAEMPAETKTSVVVETAAEEVEAETASNTFADNANDTEDTISSVLEPKDIIDDPITSNNHFGVKELLTILALSLLIVVLLLREKYEVVMISKDGTEQIDNAAPALGFRRIVRYVADLDFEDEDMAEKLSDVVRIEIRNRFRENEENAERAIVYGVLREGEEYLVYCSDQEGMILYDEIGFDYKKALERLEGLDDLKGMIYGSILA